MTSPDFDFARRPKWIAGHVLAAVAVVLFVIAGFWQLSRLDERRQRNDLISARASGPAMDLPALDEARSDPAGLEWQLVEFEATWLAEDEVILQAQSLAGTSGHDVLTPAAVDGVVVVVDRGWVPIDSTGPPVPEALPVAETVTVRGVLRSTQERGAFGPTDPPAGVLDRISRVDLRRLENQLPGPVYPMWVQLLDQQPPQEGLPRLRELSGLGEGPHLSYAVQWFVFAAIVLIGYPILLWRTAQAEPQRRVRRRSAEDTGSR